MLPVDRSTPSPWPVTVSKILKFPLTAKKNFPKALVGGRAPPAIMDPVFVTKGEVGAREGDS